MGKIDLKTLISNVGFPIAISIYLLTSQAQQADQMEKAIQQNTQAIERLTIVVDQMQKNK